LVSGSKHRGVLVGEREYHPGKFLRFYILQSSAFFGAGKVIAEFFQSKYVAR